MRKYIMAHSGGMRISARITPGMVSNRTLSGKNARKEKVIHFSQNGDKITDKGQTVTNIEFKNGGKKVGRWNGHEVEYINGMQRTWIKR